MAFRVTVFPLMYMASILQITVILSIVVLSFRYTKLNLFVIESVDSISRDGPDCPYM